jgi:hypothetical protein
MEDRFMAEKYNLEKVWNILYAVDEDILFPDIP